MTKRIYNLQAGVNADPFTVYRIPRLTTCIRHHRVVDGWKFVTPRRGPWLLGPDDRKHHILFFGSLDLNLGIAVDEHWDRYSTCYLKNDNAGLIDILMLFKGKTYIKWFTLQLRNKCQFQASVQQWTALLWNGGHPRNWTQTSNKGRQSLLMKTLLGIGGTYLSQPKNISWISTLFCAMPNLPWFLSVHTGVGTVCQRVLAIEHWDLLHKHLLEDVLHGLSC